MKAFSTRNLASGPLAARMLALTIALAATPSTAQSVGWQARWDGGLVDSAAAGWDIAQGPNGQIYAAGDIWNGARRDFLTLAWNPAGDLLWYRVKDGINESNDIPAHLIVDADGHVIVVGTATRSTASWLMTVAYDTAGNELWTRTNRNPAYRWNVAKGVAVDADGRIVVVGEISNGSTKWTSLVAYDSTGDLLWERQRELTPDDGCVAMGPSGVLAVAGRSNGSLEDFLTVAFDSAGTELWARSRDSGENRDDSAHALVLDGNGRFVVTGISETAASGTDILTVAYDVAGNEIWAATRGGPGDQESGIVAADASGNVFVAGTPDSSLPDSSLLIVSYDDSGLERWAVIVPDGVGEGSSAADMAVATDGNVVVTGRHYGSIPNDVHALTLKVSGATGAAIWTRIRAPAPDRRNFISAVGAGAAGSSFVIGSSVAGYFNDDVLAIAYDSNGDELWARDEPAVPADDVPGSLPDNLGRRAIATGYDGRVYLTGTSFDGLTLDYMTVAFDAWGNKIWEARRSNPNDFQAYPSAIAVDPAIGNVYVTGTTRSPGGNDYLTVAYDWTGAELWSRTRQGEAHGDDSACCISVTPDGLIVVTGTSDTTATYTAPGMLTVAYESGGNEVWSDEWGPEVFRAGFTNSLTVGTTGIVFVGGWTNVGGGPAGTLTVAYDTLGNRLWWQSHNSDDEVSDFILALAPTPDGGVAATGYTDPYVNENILTLVYGPDGTERWSAVADSTASGLDVATAITVDAAGRTFVTGWTYETDFSDPDFITVAYDPAGGLLWSRERGGIPGGDDYAGTLALSSRGNLFVTGSSDNGTNMDFLTLAYSPGGYELFEQRYDNGGDDAGYLAIAGPGGSAFIGGVSDGADRDFFVYQLFDDTGLFSDGFVSGDASSWSSFAP
jgi:hypothetical protein